MAGTTVGELVWRNQCIQPAETQLHIQEIARGGGALNYAFTALDAGIASRNRKNLSGGDDLGNGLLSGYGQHVLQH